MNDKLVNEKNFWDNNISKILDDKSYDYTIESISTFENLAKKITYLKNVPGFFGCINNKKIIDLACGDGWISLSLAKSGAEVYGCDISPKRIEVANRYAQSNRLNDKINFETMVCERLNYKDGFFDLAIMHAALHHCDIQQTSQQIRRVLKKGGKAVLIEDYAYHPLMALYRTLTPHKHTATEEALTDNDLENFVTPFSSHHFEYHCLLNLFCTSTHPLARKTTPLLEGIDNLLYRTLPPIKKYSKLVNIYVIK